MRYGIILTAGDIHEMLDMAAAAEAAGWDGVFYWDGVAIPGADPIYDPWVTMAAIAMRTERVRFGAIVTPPSRRRPWKLARETATLDQLSGGRLIVPVGLGALDDVAFGGVGEATDLRTRAELLDESLENPHRRLERRAVPARGKALPGGGDDAAATIVSAAAHPHLGGRVLAAGEKRHPGPAL